jgi:hypothetical protein
MNVRYSLFGIARKARRLHSITMGTANIVVHQAIGDIKWIVLVLASGDRYSHFIATEYNRTKCSSIATRIVRNNVLKLQLVSGFVKVN